MAEATFSRALQPACLLCSFIVTLTGCLPGPDELDIQRGSPARSLRVNVIQAKQDDDPVVTSIFYGKLRARRESYLVFPRGGVVKQVYKQLGETASSGEKLAELVQEGLDAQQATLQKSIDDLKKSAGEQPVPAIERQLDQLQKQMDELERELAKGVITAPYDCVIVEQTVVEDAAISSTRPAFQVAEEGKPIVDASLPQDIASRLQPKSSIWIGVGDDTVVVEVKAIGPRLDKAGNQQILFELTEAIEASWTFGQTVEIRFLLPAKRRGIWLPLSAMQREANGLWFVYAIPDAGKQATVQRRLVQVLEVSGERVLVEGALQPGEWAVVNGAHRVVPGQLVELSDVSDEYESVSGDSP